ncbi:ABC transporter substrate-binding protein [uncultured Alsobacter sp.]|uniref:substrate-binding periplasmic protein n=1 Tax=uncultured Alsobacter sp. TaxID=1748258 RepID=UPI0025D4A048|nr:transporter substrate-binding domain-containing protein [uncultured Alsobacter sp.]
MPDPRRLARNFGAIGVIVGLLLAVTFLPPDNALHEVRASGALRACTPATYPPLVTGNPDRPGIDIELLKAVAARLGVDLALNVNDAIGRDFNPRNWGLTRAQCQVIAGGVVDSQQTRSFLETSPPHARTGWAVISPQPLNDWTDRTIGVLAPVSGFDRIGLASLLRDRGARIVVVRTADELVAGLTARRFDAGVTEALLASRLADEQRWPVAWAPPSLQRYGLVFGLWKGDLTLKRAIGGALHDLEASGTTAAILRRYSGAPLSP